MDSPAGRKELTHQRIVEAAARAIRRAGFAGVGVADIMKDAGLTHGGFYAHFASRDALLCEALAHAGRDGSARLAKGVGGAKGQKSNAFRALVEGYLSERHLRSTESGCAIAALACEMPRQAPEVRAVAALSVRSLVSSIRQTLPPGHAAENAAVVAGQLVGALQLARTLGDNAEGRKLLAVTRRALLAHFEPAQSG